ncbi:hypothetical protein Sango_0235000 [Sesamum angolense]|uniref:Uncharacterized protein n=1 Tax=Sesamum angolense TaxID=2727404 RepID=A0AAE2C7L1_9LAMI|nr:hypothetical protein Sango_0235000 [Sesamum angolense]
MHMATVPNRIKNQMQDSNIMKWWHPRNQPNNFSGNLLSDDIYVLTNWNASLEILNLSSNSLAGSILNVLTNWNASLEILNLSSNSLAGSILNLMQFLGLTVLSTRNNSPEGNFPLALGSFTKLNIVDL